MGLVLLMSSKMRFLGMNGSSWAGVVGLMIYLLVSFWLMRLRMRLFIRILKDMRGSL